MLISYFKHSFLLIEGKEFSIALDPFSNIGLSEPKVKADYVFCSHSHYDHNNVSLVIGAKPLDNKVDYNIIETFHDNEKGNLRGKNNILVFTLDGYKIAFLGDYGESYNEKVIRSLKGVDILFIPIGGTYTIDSDEAYRYVKEIKPKTAIPIHYKVKGSTVDILNEEKFLNYFDNYIIKSSPYSYNDESGIVFIR